MKVEPIAIIGIGCRFPGANTPKEFWQLLRDGIDAITEVPSQRWDIDSFYHPEPATPGKINTRWGGFLRHIDRFDADFFSISLHEAQQIDPQQRLLLEVSWEALEDAGIVPKFLADSQTGVFIGISSADFHRYIYKNVDDLNAYSGTGTSISIAANRLSYAFDLKGTSMTVNTACSSSLVAVNLAIQSLQMGDANLCLVGGVHLILSPEPTIIASQSRLMAADGRCKTFDASADGYVRGEGCGVVVLKRLSDALKDGDNIQAVIRSSAVNQDGFTNGMTAPNGLSQRAVIRQALTKSGVKPAQISYVETHGTGSSLGDAVEVNALKTVLTEDRDIDKPCWLGSVKANIGHLEAASGIASLIKVVLSLQHQEIPPQLHFQKLNPYIKLRNAPIRIPTSLQNWFPQEETRLAGVSAFGFGGTNAHVILEEATSLQNKRSKTRQDQSEAHKREGLFERPWHILTLSAKSQSALQALAERYVDFLSNDSNASIADICLTTNIGRSHFNHRLAIVAESNFQLLLELKAFKTGTQSVSLISNRVTNKKFPKIAVLFTGEISDYVGIGQELYQTQLEFRQTLDRCDQILLPYLNKSLLSVLYPESEKNPPTDKATYAKVALFAVEYALFRLWQSWGIKPFALMGDGVGEYVAACVAGVFSLEDGLKLMVDTRSQLSVADITYCSPQINLISNVTGDFASSAIATPEYWANQRQPLKIERCVETLKTKECDLFVEIGSKSNLSNMDVWLPSLLPGKSDWEQILQSLAKLYVRGVEINWPVMNQDNSSTRLQLPTYPFQQQRYWLETARSNSQNSSDKIQDDENSWENVALASNTRKIEPEVQGIEFSLLYFSSNEAEFTDNKYLLLLEGAKFADQNNFHAVWIPERHFHPFGGLYPEPSILGGVLGNITQNIRIRPGSVVIPLQNPVQVAEKWSVVDNLSGGRVDISFARGWNPNDFVLAPNNYANRTQVMFDGIKTVQKLWRGESVYLPNGKGKATEVRIYPSPKQPELPTWITCSGGKERFIEAGAIGANVLTALLFQPIEELAGKIASYRESRAANGYAPDTGHVTLMLHTFVSHDIEFVRHRVRQPFREYLQNSISLWKTNSQNLEELTETERENLLDYAFKRYFQTTALLGTPSTCLKMVSQLKEVGVNEIACLIDFGIDANLILDNLVYLNQLRQEANGIDVRLSEGKIEQPEMSSIPQGNAVGVHVDSSSVLNEVQRIITQNIAKNLHINPESIDLNASFFDFGLNSLQAIELIEFMSKKFDVSVSPTSLFDYPTITQISQYLVKVHGSKIQKCLS